MLLESIVENHDEIILKISEQVLFDSDEVDVRFRKNHPTVNNL